MVSRVRRGVCYHSVLVTLPALRALKAMELFLEYFDFKVENHIAYCKCKAALPHYLITTPYS